MTSSLSKTPSSERLHIAIFGRRNVGKSSLINALTRQEIALVSDIPGTTTDPVSKAIEIAPLGPVVLVDTAGIDDEGALGELRIRRTLEVLARADFALLVIDATLGLSPYEQELIDLFKRYEVSFVVVINKVDLAPAEAIVGELQRRAVPYFSVSARTGKGIEELRAGLSRHIKPEVIPPLISDLIQGGDLVVLVVPIDLGAPKGRLILPQVQTIRDALDSDAVAIVTKERELRWTLQNLKSPPKLVVTDSQAIMRVIGDVPQDIPLTTFSILFARYKGDLPTLVRGLCAVEHLKPGDPVLIAEACTHHPLPDDIGRVKIPRWLQQYVGGRLRIKVVAGRNFPHNLSDFRLVIHCGGCMITRREMRFRLKQIESQGVPVVNYGVLISFLHGAIPRVLEPFPLALYEWQARRKDRRF